MSVLRLSYIIRTSVTYYLVVYREDCPCSLRVAGNHFKRSNVYIQSFRVFGRTLLLMTPVVPGNQMASVNREVRHNTLVFL